MTKLDRCFREKICCGTIFRGPFGETVIDSRFLTPCSNRNDGLKSGLRCLTSEMEAAKRLQMTQVLEGMRFEASEGFTCTVYLL